MQAEFRGPFPMWLRVDCLFDLFFVVRSWFLFSVRFIFMDLRS